jgi:hypothetical protein
MVGKEVFFHTQYLSTKIGHVIPLGVLKPSNLKQLHVKQNEIGQHNLMSNLKMKWSVKDFEMFIIFDIACSILNEVQINIILV